MRWLEYVQPSPKVLWIWLTTAPQHASSLASFQVHMDLEDPCAFGIEVVYDQARRVNREPGASSWPTLWAHLGVEAPLDHLLGSLTGVERVRTIHGHTFCWRGTVEVEGGMMALSDALRDQAARYVDGRLSLAALRDSLGGHAEAIVCSGDAEIEGLANELWTLLAEYEYGHRPEEGVRDEVARLIGATAVRTRGSLARDPRPSDIHRKLRR